MPAFWISDSSCCTVSSNAPIASGSCCSTSASMSVSSVTTRLDTEPKVFWSVIWWFHRTEPRPGTGMSVLGSSSIDASDGTPLPVRLPTGASSATWSPSPVQRAARFSTVSAPLAMSRCPITASLTTEPFCFVDAARKAFPLISGLLGRSPASSTPRNSAWPNRVGRPSWSGLRWTICSGGIGRSWKASGTPASLGNSVKVRPSVWNAVASRPYFVRVSAAAGVVTASAATLATIVAPAPVRTHRVVMWNCPPKCRSLTPTTTK